MKRFPRYILWGVIFSLLFLTISIDSPGKAFAGGFFFATISLFFPSKPEREKRKKELAEKEAEAKRKKEMEEAEEKRREAAKKAPGVYNKGNVDILTFGSQNNLITAGNNRITFKLRNRNPYDVIVAVRYKYSGEWESDYHTFQVAGNSIRSVETLGKAWNKATDVTIMDVY